MQRIIKNGQIIDETWHLLPKDATLDSLSNCDDYIVPLALWVEHSTALKARDGGLGVWLDSDEQAEEIGDDVQHFQVIALQRRNVVNCGLLVERAHDVLPRSGTIARLLHGPGDRLIFHQARNGTDGRQDCCDQHDNADQDAKHGNPARLAFQTGLTIPHCMSPVVQLASFIRYWYVTNRISGSRRSVSDRPGSSR